MPWCCADRSGATARQCRRRWAPRLQSDPAVGQRVRQPGCAVPTRRPWLLSSSSEYTEVFMRLGRGRPGSQRAAYLIFRATLVGSLTNYRLYDVARYDDDAVAAAKHEIAWRAVDTRTQDGLV